MSATLAAGSAQSSSGATTFTITLPSGSAAGDLVVITVGARFDFTSTPAGWTVADANDGSFFRGRTVWKILTSGDVSTGSASFVMGGGSFEGATALRITGTSSTPTVAVRSTQRWGGGGSALLAAQPSNSFSAATGSLMVYAGINDSGTAMTISRGTQAGSADTTTFVVAHANSEVLGSALSSTTVTFNSSASTSAYYVVLEISEPTGVATGSGALSLSASGATGTPVVGSGSLSLSGAGFTGLGALGSAALALSGSGSAVGSTAATGSGSLSLSGSGSATLADSGTGFLVLSATGAAEALYVTDTSNLLNGRNRRAVASSTVTRPIGATPSRAAVKYDKSVPYPPPTLVNGRPT